MKRFAEQFIAQAGSLEQGGEIWPEQFIPQGAVPLLATDGPFEYVVEVSYPINKYDSLDGIVEDLAGDFGGDDRDSGMGFGQRDISFTFMEEKDARAFIAALQADRALYRKLSLVYYHAYYMGPGYDSDEYLQNPKYDIGESILSRRK